MRGTVLLWAITAPFANKWCGTQSLSAVRACLASIEKVAERSEMDRSGARRKVWVQRRKPAITSRSGNRVLCVSVDASLENQTSVPYVRTF